MLWLLAVITFASCTASRKVEQGSSEQQRDSVVSVVMDSVAKSEARTDSNAVSTTDESHTTGTMTDKGSNEETITERVTESTDAQGNKTTTTLLYKTIPDVPKTKKARRQFKAIRRR